MQQLFAAYKVVLLLREREMKRKFRGLNKLQINRLHFNYQRNLINSRPNETALSFHLLNEDSMTKITLLEQDLNIQREINSRLYTELGKVLRYANTPNKDIKINLSNGLVNS